MTEPVRIRHERLEGGAIVSLVAHSSEWLVQGPPRPAPEDDAAPYTKLPPRGWDEMMPTIDECRLGEWDVPDHGEAWRHPWVGDERRHWFTSSQGYTLQREIFHGRGGVRLHYTVTSDRRLPFLWAPHPLFRASAGSRAELAFPVDEVIEISPHGIASKPFHPDMLHIDSLGLGDYRKIVFPPSNVISEVRIVRPDGSWVGLEWDLNDVPYLALYLERRAFTSDDCIAIEPMTGWYDNVSTAVERGLCAWVGPGHPRQWDLLVSAGQGAPPRRDPSLPSVP